MTHRRALFWLLVVSAITAAAGSPWAFAQQGYPNKPIKLISPFPPGGPSDSIARVLGNKINASLGQALVVEYKAGAGGNIGAEFVARSAPDGYTLLMTIDTPFTVNPALYPSMPFKPSDLKPVAIIASSSLMFAVHPKLGVSNVAEFLNIAKSREITFSSAGNGSPGHVAASMLAEKTGAKVNNIMYKGNTPAVLAIVSGEVDAAIVATPGLLQHVQAGKLKALAVTSSKRSPIAPDVPTTAEAGIGGVEFEVLYLMMAPAATPAPIIAALQKEIAAALAQPDVVESLRGADVTILNETGATADARLAKSRERYAATIRNTGMKLE
jgi:tripartite-type tricarboxylate transporter receptor subunit TctC